VRLARLGAGVVSEIVRVLVVDDDVFMRDLLQRTLAKAGMKVQTYLSGSELLENADLETPGVLLLDMKMPAISGLELQALLRERGVVLPIIFLTGASNIAMAVTAMRNGAVDFLEKPFDAVELVRRVEHAQSLLLAPVVQRERVFGPEAQQRLASLTPRERKVLDLMVTGRTSKMIARELGGSFRTIEIHRSRVMSKMAVTSLANLVRLTIDADTG